MSARALPVSALPHRDLKSAVVRAGEVPLRVVQTNHPLPTCRQAQAIRKGPPEAIAVLSMVGRNYRLTRDMRDAAAALNLAVAETPITLRQAYADAPGLFWFSVKWSEG